MIGHTNCCLVTSEGGGDTIYLENASGATISAGQKVLCNLGTIGSDTPISNSVYTNAHRPVLFFDNDFFVCCKPNSSGGTSAMFRRVDGTWNLTTSTTDFKNWALSTVFVYSDNGIIDYSSITGQTGNGYLCYSSGVQTPISGTASTYKYLGESNGVHYVMRDNSTNAFMIYDIDTNTIGNVVSPTTQKVKFGKIIGDRGVFFNAGYFYIFSIADTGFTELNSTLVTGAQIPLYITGTSVGDYILCTDVSTNYTNTTGSPVSHLFCYQIQSDYSVEAVTVPALAIFETKPCLICFDNRNNVLSIGTDDYVYFYQYEDGVFKNMNVFLNALPSNPSGYIYETMMSPDKKTIVVSVKDGSNSNVNIYKLTTVDHKIVKNSALYYQFDTSVTGYATGNTDSSGRYEVQTVLPSAVNYVLGTDLEPDETTIYGGVE